MINYNAFDLSQLEHHPFTFAIVKNIISDRTLTDLLENLPTKNYYRSVREYGSDKKYDVVNNILLNLENGEIDFSSLSGGWIKFLEALRSQMYLNKLSALLDTDLTNTHQEITFKNYSNKHYLSPHTDKDFVVATHLIFLNPIWESVWGGELLLHDSEHNIVRRHMPIWDQSFVFLRSDNSWHSVEAVTHLTATRRVVQVAFWKTNQRVVLPGRDEIDIY